MNRGSCERDRFQVGRAAARKAKRAGTIAPPQCWHCGAVIFWSAPRADDPCYSCGHAVHRRGTSAPGNPGEHNPQEGEGGR